MSYKKKHGECVYCGLLTEVTKEHVPPRSIFPKPYPDNLIYVLACKKCNSSYSKDDEYLRDVFSILMPTATHPEAKKLRGAGIRSFQREKKATFVGQFFGTAAPIITSNDEVSVGLEILAHRMCNIIFRIIRGLFWYEMNYRLPSTHKVRIIDNPFSPNALEIAQLYESFFDKAPVTIGNNVFSYQSKLLNSDKYLSFWLIRFFESQPFICETLPINSL